MSVIYGIPGCRIFKLPISTSDAFIKENTIVAKLSLFHRLFRYFSGRRHLHVPGTMTFPPLDTEAIKRDLALEDRGLERGKMGQPANSSTVFDEVEEEIITIIEQARNSASYTLDNHLATYAERLGSLDFNAAISDIEILTRGARSDFANELSQGADAVYTARRNLVELERELRQFREENGLGRTAHYPPSRVLAFAIMGILVLVEAILNGFFLGETHTFGLAGGVAVAFVIAVFNVLAGGIAGRTVLPQIWHRHWVRKFLGVFSLAVYLSVVILFNLAVAHYRDALSSGIWDTATIVAFQRFLAYPLGVTDLHSWLLFLIGFMFSLLAMYDALRMDDPYPGYGKLWRKVEQSREDYAESKALCLDGLSELKETKLNSLVSVREDRANVIRQYHSILTGRDRLISEFKHYCQHLTQAGNALLVTYRGSNIAARSRDDPAPLYFDQRWEMESSPTSDYGKFDMDEVLSSNERVNEVLADQISLLHEYYDNGVNMYRRIEELSEEDLTRGSAKEIIGKI